MTGPARLIVGCGYLGSRVAANWQAAGSDVYVVTRRADRAERFRTLGYRPIVADVARADSLAALGELPPLDAVLYAVGFDRQAGVPMRTVYVEGLASVLDRLPRARRFVYVSSTGVYGDAAGDWIDEGSACVPDRENGRICLAAEEILRTHAFLGPVAVCLRMAGIYGPGRIPNRDALVRGQPIEAPSGGYLNLIHVDDAATVVGAVVESRDLHLPADQLFLVSDGSPVLRTEYYAELARLVAAPPPRLVSPPAGDPAASRASGSKRVSNARMLDRTGVTLRYPSYREGLAAIIAAEAGEARTST